MFHVIIEEPIVPISTILGLDYETTSYDQRVKLRYECITEQLEKNPNYEGWEYLEYVWYGEKFNSVIMRYSNYFISTKGRLVSLSKNKQSVSLGRKDKKGYRVTTIVTGKNISKHITIHRAVACTFIPNLTNIKQLNLLTVNHDNGVKDYNYIGNLEWMTMRDNALHALKTSLYEKDRIIFFDSLIIGEWILDDDYQGTKFIINGQSDLEKLGVKSSGISEVVKDGRSIAYGCRWKIISKLDSMKYNEVPSIFIDKIKNDPSYLNNNIVPLEVTIVKDCELKYLKFCLFGNIEIIKSGFSNIHAHSVSRGERRKHKGCTFKKISRREANLLPRGLNEEQKKILFG